MGVQKRCFADGAEPIDATFRCADVRSLLWEYHEAWEDAAACYEQAIAADRSSEGFYHQLMLCYEQLGRRTEALDAYERCRQSLSALARVAPSSETTALYQKLMSKD